MNAEYTGKQIARRRKELGLTQKSLAEKLNVTDKAVSKWERGLNFPDLGLIEDLAKALETTPAALLGLEHADQNEIVHSMAEISNEQLEDAQRDAKWMGWGCIGAAALLAVAYGVSGERLSFQILTLLICTAAIAGVWMLVKFGQIRKFDLPEIFVFYGAVFSILIYLGIQFITGHSPHPILGFCLIAAASCCVQLLFYRIMVPGLAKALPLILSAGFALWRIPREFPFDADVLIFALPAVCTLMVWGICFLITLRKGTAKLLPSKTAVMITAVVLLVLGILFYQPLVRTYVHIRHNHLQAFAETLLAKDTDIFSASYGFWKVTAYPEDGLVEFRTGGSGLAPSSTYEGFYYSAKDTHIPFQGAEVPLKVNGEMARWTDGTDNWGESTRFRENWFWYETHF